MLPTASEREKVQWRMAAGAPRGDNAAIRISKHAMMYVSASAKVLRLLFVARLTTDISSGCRERSRQGRSILAASHVTDPEGISAANKSFGTRVGPGPGVRDTE